MKYMSHVFILFLGLVLVGCSSINNANQKQNLAVLTSYQIEDGHIKIQTIGYGCTFINNFSLQIDEKNNALSVILVEPDNCNMQPREVSIDYSFKHLGIDINKEILVVNPVYSDSNKALAMNKVNKSRN